MKKVQKKKGERNWKNEDLQEANNEGDKINDVRVIAEMWQQRLSGLW